MSRHENSPSETATHAASQAASDTKVLTAADAGLICGWRFFRSSATNTPAQAMTAHSAAEWLAANPLEDDGSDAAESDSIVSTSSSSSSSDGGAAAADVHDDDGVAQKEVGATQQSPSPSPSQTRPDFLWLHFNLSNALSLRWLERHAQLPEAFYGALQEGLTSTRIERADDSLVAVLNDVNFEFNFESADIATLWISVDERLVVTARTKPLRSVDDLRAAVREGDSPESTAELLEHLMRTQADVLVKVVRETTARVDHIEDAILAQRNQYPRAQLGKLRRLLVRLQRLLAPEPGALFRLLQQPPAWMSEDDRNGLAAASEEFSLMLRDMQTLQDRIKLLQEEVAAAVNEDNNKSLFVLTVVTVLALPINILAGLFGMNVGGIPLAQDEHGFWVVVGIVFAFTTIAGWWAFRKSR